MSLLRLGVSSEQRSGRDPPVATKRRRRAQRVCSPTSTFAAPGAGGNHPNRVNRPLNGRSEAVNGHIEVVDGRASGSVHLTVKTAAAPTQGPASNGASSAKSHVRGARNPARAARARSDLIGTGEV